MIKGSERTEKKDEREHHFISPRKEEREIRPRKKKESVVFVDRPYDLPEDIETEIPFQIITKVEVDGKSKLSEALENAIIVITNSLKIFDEKLNKEPLQRTEVSIQTFFGKDDKETQTHIDVPTINVIDPIEEKEVQTDPVETSNAEVQTDITISNKDLEIDSIVAMTPQKDNVFRRVESEVKKRLSFSRKNSHQSVGDPMQSPDRGIFGFRMAQSTFHQNDTIDERDSAAEQTPMPRNSVHTTPIGLSGPETREFEESIRIMKESDVIHIGFPLVQTELPEDQTGEFAPTHRAQPDRPNSPELDIREGDKDSLISFPLSRKSTPPVDDELPQ